MKKVLSILLSAVLLLTAIFVSIPMSVSAETEPQSVTPIKATPVAGFTSTGNGGSYVTRSTVMPSSVSSAPSFKYVLKTGNEYDNAALTGILGAWNKMEHITNNTSANLGEGTTHLLFYFESNGPIDFTFRFQWDNNFTANTVYEYARIGDSEWTSANAVLLTANDYGISFDSAFKGYIKIAYSSFAKLTSSSAITNLYMAAVAMGNGKATEMTFGSIMGVTEDSTSTVIEVPEEWRPTALKATPVAGFKRNNGSASNATVSTVIPSSVSTAHSFKYVLKEGSAFSNAEYSEKILGNWDATGMMEHITNTTSENLGEDTTHLLFYFESNGPIDFTFQFGYEDNFTANTVYEYARIGDSEWTSANAAQVTPKHYGISFDSAFKGYIKIAYASLSNRTFAYGIDPMYFAAVAMGNGKATEMTFGSIMGVTENSPSTVIEVPDEWKHTPVKATPIVDWNINSESWKTSTTSTVRGVADLSSAKGIKMSISASVESGEYECTGSMANSNAYTKLDMAPYYDLSGVSALMFYADIPAANILYPEFNMKNSSGSTIWSMALKPGTTYYYKDVNATEWSKGTVSYCGAEDGNTAYNGGIVMDSAFKGYIKFDVANLVNTGNEKYAEGCTIEYIRVRVKGLGGDYGNNLVFGPWFAVTADSILAEINIPKVDYDINLDAKFDDNDVTDLRTYILYGTLAQYIAENGNITSDEEIDIVDLVAIQNALTAKTAS